MAWNVSHCEYIRSWHCRHHPQATLAGTTTRSPGAMWTTSRPTSTTSPTASWPRRSPSSITGQSRV